MDSSLTAAPGARFNDRLGATMTDRQARLSAVVDDTCFPATRACLPFRSADLTDRLGSASEPAGRLSAATAARIDQLQASAAVAERTGRGANRDDSDVPAGRAVGALVLERVRATLTEPRPVGQTPLEALVSAAAITNHQVTGAVALPAAEQPVQPVHRRRRQPAMTADSFRQQGAPVAEPLMKPREQPRRLLGSSKPLPERRALQHQPQQPITTTEQGALSIDD